MAVLTPTQAADGAVSQPPRKRSVDRRCDDETVFGPVGSGTWVQALETQLADVVAACKAKQAEQEARQAAEEQAAEQARQEQAAEQARQEQAEQQARQEQAEEEHARQVEQAARQDADRAEGVMETESGTADVTEPGTIHDRPVETDDAAVVDATQDPPGVQVAEGGDHVEGQDDFQAAANTADTQLRDETGQQDDTAQESPGVAANVADEVEAGEPEEEEAHADATLEPEPLS